MMKWILALLLLVSGTAFAQIGQGDDSTKYIRYQYQYGSRMPRFWADSAQHIPYYDTARFKPQKPGAIMMHIDGKLYKWTTRWQPFEGATQLTDSTFKVGNDTITIRGTGGGGGSSNFSGLNDVTVSSPKNGQVPYYDSVTSKWKNGDPVYVNVKWFKAVGDSTTDDRAAIMKARDYVYRHGGVLFFPAGKYRISDSILFQYPIRIQGVGKSGGLHNNQSGGVLEKDRLGPIQTSTEIIVTDGKNGFVFDRQSDETKAQFTVENLTMSSTVAPGSATGGAFIVVRGMIQGTVIRECTFYGGYVQVDIQSGYYQLITGCHFSAAQICCVKSGNNIRTDTGDFTITACTFSSGTFTRTDTTKAVWWHSGGGMRVINNKFDACEFNNASNFYYDIYCANTLDPTSDILISLNSFENWYASAIYMRGIQPPYVRNIHITSNQFAPVNSISSAIDIDRMEQIVISDFEFRDWGGTVAAPAIKVTNSIDVTIGKGEWRDYASFIDITGTTNWHTDYMHGGDVAIGSKNITNISGQPTDKYTTLTVRGRATTGTFGSGLLELANQLGDGTGIEGGVVNFVHNGNTTNKAIASIVGVTDGSTTSNRGGAVIFLPKTDGSSARNEHLRVRQTGIALPNDDYINWGSTYGSSGYGLRDNAGAMEYKDASGSWTAFNSIVGGGASAHGPASRIQISAGSGVFTSTNNFRFSIDDSALNVETANSGLRFQQYTGDPTYYAIYPKDVIPFTANYNFLVKNDGSEAHMNASTSLNFTIPGSFDGHFTASGFRQTAGTYHNFGATAGSSGYGFRDNAGTMQVKNSGGSWQDFATDFQSVTNAGNTSTNEVRFNMNSAALNRHVVGRNTNAGNFSGMGFALYNDVGETVGTHGAGFEFYSSGTDAPYANSAVFFNRQGPLAFFSGSSEAARFISNGNMLIGSTTNNGAKLQVNGDATVADEAYNASTWEDNFEVPTKNAIRDKLESMSSTTTIYSGDGTLAADRTVSTGGFTTTWTGSNDNETLFSVTNSGSTSASAISGTASGTTSTGVTGTSTQYIGVFGSSTSNTGIQGQSSSGTGVIGVSSTGAGVRAQINPSSNNTIEYATTVLRTSSSGAGANNMGTGTQYELETATSGNSQIAGSIAFAWDDATAATRTARYEVYTVNSGTSARKFAVKGNGQLVADTYGAGTHTVTPATTPVYSSSGEVGERIAPKIYTGLISATAGNNPTVTVLGTNEIGSIVWTRTTTGTYTGTLTGAFTSNKTWCIIQKGSGASGFVTGWIFNGSANTVQITTYDNDNNLVDAFDNISFEIRVYP